MRRSLLASLLSLVLLATPINAQIFPTTPGTNPNPPAPTFGSDWLDAPRQDWNTLGAEIPKAPAESPGATIDPVCEPMMRPAETAEDNAMIAAGWRLASPYRAAWNIKIVHGMAATGGMCRPSQYNYFIFLDGGFIGTISPILMESRSGSPGNVTSFDAESVRVVFDRYRPSDPLCCPSGEQKFLTFKIDRTGASPVLRRE